MSEKATGWDLDCEVASRVMGWRNLQRHRVNGRDTQVVVGSPCDSDDARAVPPYSTQEYAMLAVVEEMRKRGYGVVMTRMAGEDGWGVNFVDRERRTAPGESAPTLPEAICRAALRVLDEAALSTAGEVKA